MGRNLVYWDPEMGLTRYGRTKHIVASGLWADREENLSVCGIPLPRRVNSWQALNEYPVCRTCEATQTGQ